MPINDLPKSLVDSVIEVVTKSEENHNTTIQRIVSEGLAHFGVTCISELSEGDQKALHAWTQIRLAEEGCSCGSQEVEEDDMPGDAPFHKDGDEDGEEKKDLGESVVLSKSKVTSLIKTTFGSSTKLADYDLGLDGEVYFDFEAKKINASVSEVLGRGWEAEVRLNSNASKETTVKDKTVEGLLKKISTSKLNESVALEADEIATNGAVGVADATQALPKHADVIQDTDPYTGTTQYRLLIQYATNNGTQIYPPVSLPGAVSVADLRTLVQGLPEFNEAIDQALVHASTSNA
jgi:hypothetical protein